MCGIISLHFGPDATTRIKREAINDALILSQTRGKECCGLSLFTRPSGTNKGRIEVIKSMLPYQKARKTAEWRKFVSDEALERTAAAIGHTRLITNGSHLESINNQPLLSDFGSLVFNGIVIDADEICSRLNYTPKSENDGEALFAILSKGDDASFDVKGNFSLAFMGTDGILRYRTNCGSLYRVNNPRPGVQRALFSESIISERFAPGQTVEHLKLNETFKDRLVPECSGSAAMSAPAVVSAPAMRHVFEVNYNTTYPAIAKRYELRIVQLASLKRCTRCILPETVPFITFDTEGVCNFCRNHVPHVPKGEDKLKEFLAQVCKGDPTRVSTVFAFSGGRDSSYCLHYLVNELGIRPTTYTYDWGVNTNLARRNVALMCGALGIENILISADIALKRRNIRKNISAWLHRPHPGLVPLFMAGDKQFIWYSHQLAQSLRAQLEFFSFNIYEKTAFKEDLTGYRMWGPTGANQQYGEALGLNGQLAMMWFYGTEYLRNPRLINSTMIDTLRGFYQYYHAPTSYIHLFDFLDWDERKINDTLINQYGWETADDTPTTWRIGDGTAPFYNFIYHSYLGFTENTTLNSNLIRAGKLDRQTALEKDARENQPRWPTLQWYLNIVGLDAEDVLNKVLDNADRWIASCDLSAARPAPALSGAIAPRTIDGA